MLDMSIPHLPPRHGHARCSGGRNGERHARQAAAERARLKMIEVVFTLVTAVAFVPAALAASRADRPRERLAAEMDALGSLQKRLQRAAELITQERWDEAKALVAAPLPAGISDEWSNWWSQESRSLPLGGSEDAAGRQAYLADWLLMHGERPDLAVQMFEAAQERGFELSSDQLRRLSDAYVAVGQYTQARQVLEKLVPRPAWIKQPLERIARLESGQLSPLEALRERYGASSWTVRRVALVLELWAFRASGPEEDVKRLFLLAETLGGDARLVREAIVDTKGAPPAEVRRALEELAWSAYRAYDEEAAYGYWRALLTHHPPRAQADSTLFQMAALRKEQGRCPDAVGLFRRLISRGAENAPDAQWQIGHCLFLAGDYRSALEAYRDAERRYPFDDCCRAERGNAELYALYRGLCLERLGKVRQAVGHYLRASREFPLSWHESLGGHLIDLYDAAGRLADLDTIVGAEAEAGQWPLSDLLALRRMEKGRDWEGLIGELKDRGTVAGPEEEYARAGNFRAVEAARLLGRHADETVTLLLAREGSYGFRHWVAYALGRCATPPAVAALKRSLAATRNAWACRSLVHALELSQAGRKAVEELVGEGKVDLKNARRPYRSRLTGADRTPEFGFPPAPASLHLPTKVSIPPHDPVPSRSRRPCVCLCE
jgi:tetratricopeptide (TPR) repeat protein